MFHFDILLIQNQIYHKLQFVWSSVFFYVASKFWEFYFYLQFHTFVIFDYCYKRKLPVPMSPDWDWKNFGKKKKISPPPQKRRPPTRDGLPETPYRFKKRGCILRLTLIQHCHRKQITFALACVKYVVHFASPSCLGCWNTTYTRAFFSSSYGFVTSWNIKKFKVSSLHPFFFYSFRFGQTSTAVRHKTRPWVSNTCSSRETF